MFRSVLRPFRPSTAFFTVGVAFLLTLAACAPQTVDQIRTQYTAELNAWMPIEPEPVEAMVEMADGEMADGEMADGEMADGEMADGEMADGEMMPAEPATRDIRFDVVVHFSGQKPLDGITVNITHADSAQSEKAVHLHYIETAGILKGSPVQETFTLEGIEFEDGDIFSASVQPVVPEAEKGNYREFAAGG